MILMEISDEDYRNRNASQFKILPFYLTLASNSASTIV